MKADGGYAPIVQKYRRLEARPISDGAHKPPSDPVWAQ